VYNGRNYSKDDLFIGNDESYISGKVVGVGREKKTGIEVDFDLLRSYISKYDVYFAINGNRIETTSIWPVMEMIFTYIQSFDDRKIDGCNDKTLFLDESLQRWIVEQTILKLGVDLEVSQQKLVNQKQL
jgi:hypothetical protein